MFAFRDALIATAFFAIAGCGAGQPAAQPSELEVTVEQITLSGSGPAIQIAAATDCPSTTGIGLRAAASGIDVEVLFPSSPAVGAVYDLSDPGITTLVVVGATVGDSHFCQSPSGDSGKVTVYNFQMLDDRLIADVQLAGVQLPSASVEAHLYH